MKRKIIPLVLTLSLSVALASCGADTGRENEILHRELIAARSRVAELQSQNEEQQQELKRLRDDNTLQQQSHASTRSELAALRQATGDDQRIAALYIAPMLPQILRESWDLTCDRLDPGTQGRDRNNFFERWGNYLILDLWCFENAETSSSGLPGYNEVDGTARIPGEFVEDLLTRHFDVSAETLRSSLEYNAGTHTYAWRDESGYGWIGEIGIAEIVYNADSTVTVAVTNTDPDGNTYILSDLTLRRLEDGSLRYVRCVNHSEGPIWG